MKYPFLFFVLFSTQFIFGQQSEINLTTINESSLREKFKQSDKEYQIVVLYTDWCKPCRAFMPDLIKLLPNYQNCQTYYINPDPLKYDYIIKKYLAKYPEIKESYILDDTFKGNVKKRMIAFKDRAYPHEGLVGLPTVIIYSKDFTPLDILIGHDLDKLKASLTKIVE